MADPTTPAALQEGNENLFDAISHGIDNEGALPDPPQDEPEGETPEGDEPEGDQPAGEGDGEGDGDATDDEAPAEGEEPPEGQVRDPVTGKFVPKQPVAEVKAKDPVNDPIPKELKQETRERITTLIGNLKEVTAKEQTLRREYDAIVNGVMSTGATPEQYGEVLQFLGAINSQDPAKQREALNQLEDLADNMATLLGVERRSADPLQAHADIKEALQAGRISKEFALETARLRNRQNMTQNIQGQQRQQQDQTRQFEQAKGQAQQTLDQLENTLRATDPLYEQKKAQLIPILQPIFKTIHPSQWVNHFQQAYQNLRVAAPALPTSKSRIPKNQPARAGKGSMGGSSAGKQAGSALDAVNAALGDLGV